LWTFQELLFSKGLKIWTFLYKQFLERILLPLIPSLSNPCYNIPYIPKHNTIDSIDVDKTRQVSLFYLVEIEVMEKELGVGFSEFLDFF
jgi:hypothetical protein